MNSKAINILTTSIFLLVFAFAVLVGQNIKTDGTKEKIETKADFRGGETSGHIVLYSGEILTAEDKPRIWHAGFTSGDYRQKIVQEAYDLWGLDFVSLIECENGQWLTGAVGDYGKSHWLCMLNTRWHKEPLSSDWNDWRNQISVCYRKRKTGTKFYGLQRMIWGKKCSEVVKERFYIL